MTADSWCFVCGKLIEGATTEAVVRQGGGRWVFTMHEGCRDEFEQLVPARFNELVLRALGRPKPLP